MNIWEQKYIIILVLIFVLIIFNSINEGFYDFKNLPDKYKNMIDDINKVPVSGIPKIIHQICPRDKKRWVDKWYIGYETWKKHFPEPEYTHMLWFDDELEEIIKSDFPWFLDVFRNYDKNIKRIDMVRPFILWKYGGIYADMDYVCYKNFYNQLPPDKVSTPESPYKENEFIQNALLISPPKHNFWLLVIDEAFNRKNMHVWAATGPQLFSFLYYNHPDMLNILPYELYNPNVLNDDYKKNEDKLIAKHLLSVQW
jgi:mannosyltransferase OCH1-like enzyme